MRTSHLASLVAFTFVIGCSPPKQTTVNQTSAAVSLPVEQGGWSLSYGEINPPCSTQGNGLIDNPIIASFNTGVSTGGGTGTQLDTAALNFGCECCTCVGYQKDFAVGSLNSDGWALTGYFHSQRSNDPFTVASMRIDLISGGTEVGNVTLAGEQRTNNCVGGSERTIVVSDPGTFSLRLSSISPNTSFDTLRIILQGYDCQDANQFGCTNSGVNNEIDVANFKLVQPVGCNQNSDCQSGYCVANTCCNSACTNVPTATSSCGGGTCVITACSGGHGDCNGNISDGCEADLDSDSHNCGACGNNCGFGSCIGGQCCPVNCSFPHTQTSCGGGVCQITGCDAGWANCDGNTFNGCETNLMCANAVPCAGGCAVDTDGDGLNDVWETVGVDSDCDGTVDIPLHAPPYNASYVHKDIFVHQDWMTGDDYVTPAAIQMVVDAFANAPVANPDGQNGIHLYVEQGVELPHHTVMTFGPPNFFCTGTGDAIDFFALKGANFDPHLRPVFHYVISGHYHDCSTEASCAACGQMWGSCGVGELPGNDFMITFGQDIDLGIFQAHGQQFDDFQVASTFMHELGHNLSLRHGGADDVNNKPNYISTMNYLYTQGVPLTSTPGIIHSVGWRFPSYASYVPPPLDEYGLDENVGIQWFQPTNDLACMQCPGGRLTGCSVTLPEGPTDWNCDGAIESDVQFDINLDGQLSSVLQGVDDWTRVNEVFQCLPTYADGAAPPEYYPPDEDRTVNLKLAIDEHRAFPPVEAAIDIRPGCDGNAIALSSPDMVPVAIYSSPTLDATTIDVTTLTLQGESASRTSLADVNGDGLVDLIAEFPMSGLHLVAASTFARLSGALFAGPAIFGSDSVVMVPRIVIGRSGCPLYRPPVARCMDVTAVADATCHANAVIDAGSSDPDAITLTVAQDPPSPIQGDGVHTVTLTADNGVFSATCTAQVTILDETPPSLSASVTPTVLWPPNHKLVPITPTLITADNCDPHPALSLVSITSSEPAAPGDIVAPSVNDIQLAATRFGGDLLGRTYTITFRATDRSHNSTDDSATVTVPHNQ